MMGQGPLASEDQKLQVERCVGPCVRNCIWACTHLPPRPLQGLSQCTWKLQFDAAGMLGHPREDDRRGKEEGSREDFK